MRYVLAERIFTFVDQLVTAVCVAFRWIKAAVYVFLKKKSTPSGVLLLLEVPARFELANESFADSCLTTWPRYHLTKTGTQGAFLFYFVGAGDEARTRYLHLGKVALYRMSYTRISVPTGNRGASGRNRTNDTRIFSPLLYLLSYRGMLSRALSSAQMHLYGDPERTRTVDLQRDRLAC